MNSRNPKRKRDRTTPSVVPSRASETARDFALALQRRALGQLAGGWSVEDMASSILRDVQLRSGRPNACFVRVDPKTKQLVEMARCGDPEAPEPLARDACALALRTQRAVQDAAPQDGAGALRAVAVLPLFVGSDVVGLVALWGPDATAFDPEELADLELIAAPLAQVVYRSRAPFGGDRTTDQVLHAQRLESIGALVGGVAHDFNNLLGVILGYVELGAMKLTRSGGPAAMPHLDAALATLNRARGLSDLLLGFSRPRSASADVCDPNEIVHQARDLLAETLDRRIRFEVRAATAVPATPLCAADMRQLLTNLCLNAAHAMPEGGTLTVETCTRRVTVGEEAGLRPGTYVGIHVSDTGPGIADDMHEAIFQPGFTTSSETGTGLGLWVVRTLVHSVGGRVSVTSSRDGARFAVWLPNHLAVHSVGVVEGVAATDAPTVDVLIVDDEPGVREVTREVLELDGYTVRVAATGHEGVEALRSEPGGFALILLDNHLPDIRGVDLLEVIAALPYAPHVVIVTGMPGEPELEHLPPGVSVLSKPYLQRHLAAMLDQLDMSPTRT